MTLPSFYLEHTPVEEFELNGRTIHVKRDDLYASPPAPPLAKLRGARVLLERISSSPVRLVGCFQTRVSNVGHGLAAACKEFPGLKCLVVSPSTKRYPEPESLKHARALGAEVHLIPANRLSINYAQARSYVEERGGSMLPFGIECREAVLSVASEAALLPTSLRRKPSVILCCGSGVTLAGLLLGLPVTPRRIIGISSGRAPSQITRCIIRHLAKVPKYVQIVPPAMPYYDAPDLRCPFPCHPNYDLKAWEYLSRNLNKFDDPILFWNVGG